MRIGVIRVLSLLFVAVAFAAVFWHRQAFPPPVALVVPPYPSGHVQAEVLPTGALPEGGEWLVEQDGPPDTGLFVGSSRLRAELRKKSVVDAWQRVWSRADSHGVVMVRVIEFRSARLAGNQKTECEPEQSLDLGSARTAGFVRLSPTFAVTCAATVLGRTFVEVAMSVSAPTTGAGDTTGTTTGPDGTAGLAAGPNPQQLAEQWVRTIYAQQVGRVPVQPDLPALSWRNSDVRTAMNSIAMVFGLGLPLVLALSTLLFDNATWRRAVARLVPATRAGTVSLDRAVRRRLAARTASVLARTAVYAWAFRCSEAWRLGLWGSIALVVGAVALTYGGERLFLALRPGRWRPAVFRGGGRVVALVGVAVSLAMVVGAGYLAVLGFTLATIGFAPGGGDWISGRVGYVLVGVAVVVVMMSRLPVLLVRRLGMRHLRTATETDSRPPALLLRSFADDRRVLRARNLNRASVLERFTARRFERFEEVVAAALAERGPVLALSQVGERLPPPLGAARRSFSMQDWQAGVADLIGRSRTICVTLGRSESLLWEIGQLREHGALGRAVFVVPPVSKAEQRRRLAVLGHVLGVDWRELDHTRTGTDVIAVAVPAGIPIVFTASAPDDLTYELALQVFGAAALGPEPGTRPDVLRLTRRCLELAHRRAPVIEAGPARRRPQIQVYAPGQAPVFKPWWQRLSLYGWILTGVITVASMCLFGTTLSSTASVTLPEGVTSLAVDAAGTTYAVSGRHAIFRISTGGEDSTAVADVSLPISDLVVERDAGYFASAPTGSIGRVDLRSGQTVWSTAVGPGTGKLAAVGERILAADVAGHRIVALSAATGAVEQVADLPAAPYDVVVADGTAYVSMAAQDEVLRIDPVTLSVDAHLPAPGAPRGLAVGGARVFVATCVGHELLELSRPAGGTPRGPQYLSVQAPQIAGAGRWIAIQGMEWVSVIQDGGPTRRVPIVDNSYDVLAVTGDGAVIMGYEDGHILRISRK